MAKAVKEKTGALPVLALLLAWLVPGAGHVCVGRIRRGIIIFVVIAATFWAGVAVGGVMTVDYYGERWWFMAEMLTGAHGLVGWQQQKKVYQELARYPEIRDTSGPEQQSYIQEKLAQKKIALVAPADSIARVYAGVAGLLNLMCMFDAFMLALIGQVGEPPPTKARKQPKPETP